MKRTDIEKILNPKAIAVVGANNEMHRPATGFVACLQEIGFEGLIYPINPNVDESLGIKAYPTLTDAPGPVDHVVVAVPACNAPSVIEDAVKKGVRSVQFFTSGFAEVATDEGKALQKRLDEMDRGRLRILGPNCFGFYNPKAKIACDLGQPAIAGGAGFVSQSGGLSLGFIQTGIREGNFCSKVVSIGNSMDLRLTDFLEYFSEDDETEVICTYIEGLGDGEGERFLEAIRNLVGKKPVLIWKGGLTEQGARAAQSHTAALAGDSLIWPTLARQYGVILVDSIEEMHDFIKLYRFMPPPQTKRSCLVAFGGGSSVTYTDVCTLQGIELPELRDETKARLFEFLAQVGTMVVNPVDLSSSGWLPGAIERTLNTVGDDPNIDAIIFVSHFAFLITSSDRIGMDPKKLLDHQAEGVGAAARATGLPVVCSNSAAFESLEAEELRLHMKEALNKQGVPSFPTIERTVKAFRRYYEYHQHVKTMAL